MPRISIFPLALALAAACSNPTGTTVKGGPSVSFSYSGEVSGRFTATGDLPGPVGTGNGTGAGWEGDVVRVVGVRTYANSHGDAVALDIPNLTAPGTFPISPAPCSSPGCTFATLGLDKVASMPSMDHTYWFTSGEIDVTFYDGHKVRGTFHGTARNVVTGAEVRVDDGRFDVFVVQ